MYGSRPHQDGLRRRSSVRSRDERGDGFFRLRSGQRLLRSQLLCERCLGVFGFDRHLFPEGLFILGLAKLGFRGFEVLHDFMTGGAMLLQLLGQTRKFGAKVVGLVPWSLRRDEGAGLECRVLEGAVEPDANLPGELECREHGAMISDQRMTGGVACSPHFIEELGNLARKDALLLQAADEFVLCLLRRHIDADMCRDMLGEELCQLAQLEQRGIRILREIPFREQTQT